MPRYKGVLTLEDTGPDTPMVHLFDYSSEDSKTKSLRKQVIAMESCIFLGRRNLATIKAKNQPSSGQSKPQKNENKDELTNGKPGTETEKEVKTEDLTKENQDVKDTEKKVKTYLKEGQDFQGYILKCPNGPYDYAMKLWDTGRAAPSEVGYPKEGEEVPALVLDRNGDFLTVACGPNIAFARRKNFLCNGVDPDDLSLPFARLKVSLRRLQEREALVPAAGWEALPTQVVVAPYDVY